MGALVIVLTTSRGLPIHFTCISLDNEHGPSGQTQHCLDSDMQEVAKKEVVKLLHTGIIYLISYSDWVSLVHVVPKKQGMTIVKNEKDELISMRMVIDDGCLSIIELNTATRKDHYPLPFIELMSEMLAKHSFFCYLDGYLVLFQVPIHPNNLQKMTFTHPYSTFVYRRMRPGLCNTPYFPTSYIYHPLWVCWKYYESLYGWLLNLQSKFDHVFGKFG